MKEKEILSSIRNLNANKDSNTWDQRTYQRAPHKPFLLLSITDGIESGWITDSEITLNQDLIETFFRYWRQIMGEDRNTTIALPFYHMKSEPFWELELLAAEPFQKYHAKKGEEEAYSWQKNRQRRQGFGIKVRKNYDNRCAICRTKAQTPNGQSLVEGAHIIPWSKSKNDDPRNGMALCKTHHWMFDTHLLTVLPDYRIKLSTWLKQEGEKIEHTLAWDRKEIMLPDEERFLPNEDALEVHFQEFKTSS